MIFRQYDLAIYQEEVDNIINDPFISPSELSVTCSGVGSVSLLIHARKTDKPREMKRNRHFRRFLLFGGVNEELIELLSDEKVRVLNRHDFDTEQGSIVVLDYQTLKE